MVMNYRWFSAVSAHRPTTSSTGNLTRLAMSLLHGAAAFDEIVIADLKHSHWLRQRSPKRDRATVGGEWKVAKCRGADVLLLTTDSHQLSLIAFTPAEWLLAAATLLLIAPDRL